MMTTSAGSSITLRVDRYPFDTAEVGVGIVGDVSRTGNASTRMCSISDHRGAPDWSDRQSAVDRRRSFAAATPSRLSTSPPTIEDIEVESSDEDDSDTLEEKNQRMRLLSKDIEETLRGDDLHLEEPLQIPTTTMDDCSPLEELDRVTTLQSFSPAEDWRRRRRVASALRYSPLYRCYSTTVDPLSSPNLGSGTPRQRRVSWGSFDDRLSVHPAAVDRFRQHDHFQPADEHFATESIQHAASSVDSGGPDREVGQPAPLARDDAHTTPYLRDQLRAMFQVADNRLAMKLFGSHNALLKEKQRQKAVGNFVIHPCSNFR